MPGNFELNVYATPAILTLALLVLEIVVLVVALPETRKLGGTGTTATKSTTEKAPAIQRLSYLSRLGKIHFLFLALFSGECSCIRS